MAIDIDLFPSFEESSDAKNVWGARMAGVNLPHPSAIGNDPRFANVRAPGQAMLNAGHERRPTPGAHNWIPRGPRNVAGRVRALAIHPHDDNIMFAGSGLGGLWKSENGGESWFPLWHDEPSLSIAGIAIQHTAGEPIANTTVWVATGEPVQNPPDFVIVGAGVFRSTDNGVNFTPIAPVAQLDGMDLIEAIACHPTDRNHAWVVGTRGVFRIMVQPGAAPPVIDQFDAGVEYSDVAFGGAAPTAPAPIGPQPHPFCLYLCRKFTTLGDIVRIDNPTAAVAAIAPLFAPGSAQIAQPIPAGGTPAIPENNGNPVVAAGARMVRAKFSICRDTPSVLFVVYAQAGGTGGFGGVFRTQQAHLRPSFNAAVWNWVPIDVAFDFIAQSQGIYDLAIGVSPTNPEHLFVGLPELFLSRDANHPIAGLAGVTWVLCVNALRFGSDRETHPDFHAIVFQQVNNPPDVFTANDGGVYRNRDYHLAGTTFLPFQFQHHPVLGPPNIIQQPPAYPLNPEPTHLWERRSFGLTGSQPFDVTSSPISPNLYGSGFIDNGCWFSSGGDTWRFVSTGDGSFVAFDANDPYQFLVTWQAAIEFARFAGDIQEIVPLTNTPIPVTPNRVLWRGFDLLDQPRFIGDAVMHPTRPFHILATRHNRVYRSTDAEQFQPLPVGSVVEIVFIRMNGTANDELVACGIEPARTPGGIKLGLVDAQIEVTPTPSGSISFFRCAVSVPGPWNMSDGDQLSFTLVQWFGAAPPLPAAASATRTPVTVTFRAGQGIADITRVTPAELAALIQRAIDGAGFTPLIQVSVRPCFLNAPMGIELVTTRIAGAGGAPGASIRIDGTAAPALGVTAGTYTAEPNRPASLTLQTMNNNQVFAAQAAGTLVLARRIDLGGLTLSVGVNGAALAPVSLIEASVGDPRAPSAALLASAIQTAAGAGLEARPVMMRKRAVLLSDTGQFRIAGTAAAQIFQPPPAVPTVACWPLVTPLSWTFLNLSPIGAVNRFFDLTPPGAAAATRVTFTAADVIDLARVVPEEIARHINAQLVAAGVAPADLRCVVAASPALGDPSEIAFAPSAPEHLWVGSSDGHVFRSTDDGVTWRDITDRRMLLQERVVEAIVVDPGNPDIAYVGLNGKGLLHTNDAGMLFKTFDGGNSWVRIGDTIRTTDDRLLPISAIEIDPLNPSHVYVATSAGVWFSNNGGGAFSAFSQGLPNVVVMDLELEETSRTLRAALWGRGVWERHIGDEPPKDRRVFIRSSIQDQGYRPLIEGHDPAAFTPQTSTIATSPDIKNAPLRPAIGNDDQIDGVEFDELIDHEEPAEGQSTVFVQVHNHGSFPATGVRVTALWADATDGLPPLSTAFWDSVRAGAPVAPAPWTMIGSSVLAGNLVVGYPRVVGLPVNWPATIGDFQEIGILVAVTSVEDAITTTAADTNTVVRVEPKVAVRLTETRRLIDAREIHLAATGRTGFSIAAGSVAAALGFAVAPAAFARFVRGGPGVAGAGGPGTFNLTGVAPPHTLDLQLDGGGPLVRITFAPPLVTTPANVTAAEIRRAINRELRLRGFPARAVIGKTELSVRGSSTDEGRRPLALTSSHLADFVVRDAPVAAGDRPALFDLIARLNGDVITPATDNHFLLRVTNRGTADQAGVRCRIYNLVLPVAAAPLHVAEQVHATAIPGRGSDVVDIVWNPGGLAGPFAVILATADHPDREPLVLPAGGFANLDAVRAFCRTMNNAAFRVMTVTT
jgi:photosystem II stability/assembly factor-like uncharacterized protein